MKDIKQFENEVPTNVSEENGSMPQKQFIVNNGSLIAYDSNSPIYLVQRGHRHLIPNDNVLESLFVNHHSVHFFNKRQLNSIPLGVPLSENACLIKGNGTNPVYLYSNGAKSHIRSREDFDHAGFDWGKIHNLPQEEVDNITTIRDFIVERNQEIIIQANEIPKEYDAENDYGVLTQFTCKCKERNVTCNILLPPEKCKEENEKNCEEEYPVLYLYHGLGINSEWIHSDQGRIKQIIGNMVRSGLIPDMIVVMPDMMYSGGETKAYDFYRFKASLKEVMSYVENHYKVKRGKENTAIAGLSLGGTTALYNAYLFRDTFQYVGAFCPTSILLYQPSKGITKPWIPKDEDFILGTDENSFTFIANGTADCSAGDTPKFESRVLRENSSDNVFALLPDGGHCWDTFRKLFYVFMAFDFFRKR